SASTRVRALRPLIFVVENPATRGTTPVAATRGFLHAPHWARRSRAHRGLGRRALLGRARHLFNHQVVSGLELVEERVALDGDQPNPRIGIEVEGGGDRQRTRFAPARLGHTHEATLRRGCRRFLLKEYEHASERPY